MIPASLQQKLPVLQLSRQLLQPILKIPSLLLYQKKHLKLDGFLKTEAGFSMTTPVPCRLDGYILINMFITFIPMAEWQLDGLN